MPTIQNMLALVIVMVLAYPGILSAETCDDTGYERSCWVRKTLASSKLIIFTHGISGGSDHTWQGVIAGEQTSWPEIVEQDELYADADILVVDYFSARTGDSPSIDKITESFIQNDVLARGILGLADDGTERYSDIVFISHSMGGLITRNALLKEPRLAAKTKAIFTFATPTGGSQLANWLSLFSKSNSLEDMTQLFGIRFEEGEDGWPDEIESSFLTDLRDEWLNGDAKLMDTLLSYCAFETRPTEVMKLRSIVVEKRDAGFLCNRLVGLWNDHNGTVIPSDTWKGHSLLSTWYMEVFPERSQYDTHQQLGDVVLVPCETDFYDDGEYSEMLSFLTDIEWEMDFRWRYAVSLSDEWRPEYAQHVWKSEAKIPSVLIMHYSCFQSGGENDEGWRDRKLDNVAFLESLRDKEIKVVFFSRAFTSNSSEAVRDNGKPGYRWYASVDGYGVSEKVLAPIRDAYFQAGCRRMYAVPVGVQSAEARVQFERDFKREVAEAIATRC